MNSRVFVPADSTARSLGADDVAQAVAELGQDVELVRNGSRGLYWLEPLLEIETAQGRIGFGPVNDTQIADLFKDGVPDASHPDCLGLVEELPYLKDQQRLTAARVGIIDPLSIEDYCAQGGFRGLATARELKPADIVQIVTESGLRGRGGAAFPTGIKWQTVLDAEADTDSALPDYRGQKYIICNADEGDSGTFVDRMIMESDPFVLIEGMVIAGLAVGAGLGYIYCRAEYPQAFNTLQTAINIAGDAGYLGDFQLEVRKAAGAYICGEETSMLESLEGKRGLVRYKPPLPAISGFFGQPTVINNVISLASVPIILDQGASHYRDFGVGRSTGTLTVQLAGNCARPGLVEIPFGISLREVLEDYGGGTRSGRPIKAVQAGGPLGPYIPPEKFDTALDYEAFKEIDAMVGHGGIVVFDDSADLGHMARFAMEFCTVESCGKCTPCRIGSVRGLEVIDKIRGGEDADNNRILLKDLCQTMMEGSLCAMGGMTPLPVLSIMQHWPEEL
ncbi:MAG: NADH-ubiquinone oxidoreductase-F iron-sulfur binding region domain-containing protein [Halieaceae bacterium]